MVGGDWNASRLRWGAHTHTLSLSLSLSLSHIHTHAHTHTQTKIRTCCVIDVKVRHEQNVDRSRVHLLVVEERQALLAAEPWMRAAVKHDGLSLELEEAARPADLVARAERNELERLVSLRSERHGTRAVSNAQFTQPTRVGTSGGG